MPLQIRRGTDAERLNMTQPLASGELLYVTNTQRIYVGDNSTLGGVAVTGYTNEDAQDAAAGLFSNGTHTGISFTYNDALNRIDAAVDLSAFNGPIVADSVIGSVFADDSTLLVDGVSGRIVGPVFANVTGNVTGNLVGNVTGNLTGNTTGYHTGDVKGSVFGDDSGTLVDAVSGIIFGDIENDNVTTDNIISGSIIVNRDPATNGITIFSEASLEDNVDIFNIITAHDDSAASGITFTRSRGTIAAPTALASNNNIFSLVFAGQSSDTVQPAVRLDVKLDGSVGTDIVPGTLVIATADSTGLMTDRLTIDSKGISQFAGMVQLPTFADETAANAAVITPVNGMMYYDSGASKVKARQAGAWVALT